MLERIGRLSLALLPAALMAAAELLGLDVAELEVRARRVVELLVSMVDVTEADNVPDSLTVTGVVVLGDLEAHVDCEG